MSRFEIGISTRNRWDSLTRVLRIARELFGYGPTIRVAIDGGAVEPTVRSACSALNIKWYEYSDRKGYILRRNQLADMCDADYYLSLDDDSYPVSGSIDLAVSYLDVNPSIGVLGFQILRPDGTYQVRSIADMPYQTRAFVGCAHLLRVSHFRALGGYYGNLIHQGEEIFYGAALLAHGLSAYHFPGINFVHEASAVSRSSERIQFYTARNKLLWAFHFAPSCKQLVAKSVSSSVDQIVWAIRERSFNRLRGLLAGVLEYRCSQRKGRMSIDQYLLWKKMQYY